jgi:hypothetical protein
MSCISRSKRSSPKRKHSKLGSTLLLLRQAKVFRAPQTRRHNRPPVAASVPRLVARSHSARVEPTSRPSNHSFRMPGCSRERRTATSGPIRKRRCRPGKRRTPSFHPVRRNRPDTASSVRVPALPSRSTAAAPVFQARPSPHRSRARPLRSRMGHA